MRETTKAVIFQKFNYYLTYTGRKGGDTSVRRAVQSLTKVSIEQVTGPVLKAYLFGFFTALCYDVVALLEAGGKTTRKNEDLAMLFEGK
jgi:hypothetical protein